LICIRGQTEYFFLLPEKKRENDAIDRSCPLEKRKRGKSRQDKKLRGPVIGHIVGRGWEAYPRGDACVRKRKKISYATGEKRHDNK